ncbi:MAG: hypothetical protein AAGK04_02815 [Planctomycetota bacterium]
MDRQDQPGQGTDAAGEHGASPNMLDALTGLEAQLTQIRQAHAEQQATAAELDKSRQRLEDERASLETRVAELDARQSELEAASERTRAAEAQVREQTEQIEAREHAVQELEREADRAHAEALERLGGELDALRQELDGQREALSTRESELHERIASIEAISRDLGSAQERVGELEPALEAARGRAEQAERELGELRERAERVEGEWSGKSSEFEVELERVRQRVGELEPALSSAEARAASAEGEAEELRQRVEQVERELNESSNRAESQHQEAGAAMEQSSARITELETALEAARGESTRSTEALEQATKRIEEIEAQCRALEQKAAEGGDIGPELEQRLSSMQAERDEATAKYDELEKRAREIAGSLERRTGRLRAAEKKIAKLQAGGTSDEATNSIGDTGNPRRRERLRRQRDLLRTESSKIRRAADALRQKFAEADRVLAQRSELRTAARAVVEAQKKLQREKSTTRAVWNIAGVAVAVAAIGALSFSVVRQVVPGQYAATATFAADGRGREPTPEDLAGWREYHEALVEDPRFVQNVAQRMNRRGLAALGDITTLRREMSNRLDQQPSGDRSFELQWIGAGSSRTERELDTLFGAVLAESNAARKHRPDGLQTVAVSPATAGIEPIDRSQLYVGLVVFGVLAVVAVGSGAFVWRRMSRAKSDFERELRVVAALGDVETMDLRRAA